MSQVTIKSEVMWAQLEERNEMSDKYQVDLCNLSDAACEALEQLGIEVRFDDEKDKGSFITCKSNRPIRAYDPDGSVIDGRTVGNGSECVGRIKPYDWTFKGKSGTSPSLERLVITSLELFDGEDGGDVNYDEAL